MRHRANGERCPIRSGMTKGRSGMTVQIAIKATPYRFELRFVMPGYR